jgi:hypothetical protein
MCANPKPNDCVVRFFYTQSPPADANPNGVHVTTWDYLLKLKAWVMRIFSPQSVVLTGCLARTLRKYTKTFSKTFG